MRVIVVGAGIGGLSAGIALRRAGIAVEIFDKSRELKELGTGLGLYPNAIKALREIELANAVTEAGNPLRSGARILSSSGKQLLDVPSEKLEDRFGGVTLSIRRPALQRILLDACINAGGEVTLGHTFSGYSDDPESGAIEARFRNDIQGEIAEHADLLVGADGLRSSVRSQALGDGAPDFAGCVAWRGLVTPCEAYLGGRSGFEIQGAGSQFGLVDLGNNNAYWFFTRNTKLSDSERPSDNKAAVVEHTKGWCEPVPSVVRATRSGDIHYDRIYHREPIERWGEGRVTLLGDAAHPMTPDLGQGACQAIEDSVVLGRSLSSLAATSRTSRDDISRATERYEDKRIKRTAYVSRASLRTGQISRVENPLLRWVRNTVLSSLPEKLLVNAQIRQMEKINSFDV